MLKNKKYKNLVFLSLLKSIKNIRVKKRSKKLKIIYNISNKLKSEKDIISTCLVTGGLKKIQKKIALNRHFIRTTYIKKNFSI